jgi:pyridoxal phosphate-dependent aminotransferase EpsN
VLDERVAQRRAVAERYRLAFAGTDGVAIQGEASWGTHSRWLTVVYVDPERCPVSPAEIIGVLAERNIEARPVWRPMHTQPMFRDAQSVIRGVSDRLYQTGICLPSSSSLTVADQERVTEAFLDAVSSGVGGSATFRKNHS